MEYISNLKECDTCKELKVIAEFEHQKNRPNPRKTCKACRYKKRDFEKEKIRHREYAKQYRKENPEKVRQSFEKSVYGVTKEVFEYTECWICGSSYRLCIDHDHNTSEVRGLLCTNCNAGLGHFKDDQKALFRAIEYLRDGPHFQLKRK